MVIAAMRSFLLSLLALLVAGIANAVSASGNRLLVVLDDLAEQDKYSKFFGDLGGTQISSDPASFR